jgi:hypothetical protein
MTVVGHGAFCDVSGAPSAGVGLIRDAVQLVLQELIEVGANEQIGAGRYERSDLRRLASTAALLPSC